MEWILAGLLLWLLSLTPWLLLLWRCSSEGDLELATSKRPGCLVFVMDEDFHFHVCENCDCTFSHLKSLASAAGQVPSHACPRCGSHVNFKTYEAPSVVDVPDYYGPDGTALFTTLEK